MFSRESRRTLLVIGAILLSASQGVLARAQDVERQAGRILPAELPNGSSPGEMLRDSLLQLAAGHFGHWKADYEQRTTPEQIAAYQVDRREKMIQQVGGLPGDSPLQPQVTGRVERQSYRVEKILYESQPNFFVTAALFLPSQDRFPSPWPAVVVLCGHAAEGKLQDGYQRGAALAAINGIAALIVDPIGQGERSQISDSGEGEISPTTEHSLVGCAAIPLGWNTARWMIHDAMRSIDYLESRPDIQADRIGVMGNSGGGTQSSYLMALDERVAAAAPSCYLTTLEKLLTTIGPQDAEQNIYGQIAWGLDHSDTILMRAPRPTLIACATQDFFDIEGTWTTYRIAKRFFDLLGAARAVEIVETNQQHGWHPALRRASVQFMCQHLSGRLDSIDEPDVVPLSPVEMQVTSEGQVRRIPDSVSVFDHIRQESTRLESLRQASQKSLGDFKGQVRVLTGIRQLSQIPFPEELPVAESVVNHYAQHALAAQATLRPMILRVDDGVWLPVLLARPRDRVSSSQPENASADNLRPVCLLSERGLEEELREGGEIQQQLNLGKVVLAADVRGIGQTAPTGKIWYHQRFGKNGGNAMLAYLLGKSLVGLRAEDCLTACRWLRDQTRERRVDVVASGELAVPALHACALESELIGALEIRGELKSWTELTHNPLLESLISNVVHGALRVYDLPDLAKILGERLSVVVVSHGEEHRKD